MENEAIRIGEAEELIRGLREGCFNSELQKEAYTEARGKLLGMDPAEEEFSSDGMYWWYRTVRETAYEDFAAGFGRKLTVSVTSYPARMGTLAASLQTVFDQTRKPDEVILWLADAQFPGMEAELPEEIRAWIGEGKLTLRWCEDLKPHKKYFWMLQENRDGLTVTVDDDLCFAPDMLEMLTLSFIRHPETVSAMRVHLMAVAEDGKLLPYARWVMETDAEPDRPGQDLFATTGAGTLYPPGLLGERFFDRQAILDTCLMADDLWMKANELMDGIPVVLACRNRGLRFVPGSQDDTLWKSNREGNDAQWEKIRNLIDAREGKGALEKKLAAVSLERYSAHASRRADTLQGRVTEIRRQRDEQSREKRELQKQVKKLREEKALLQEQLDHIRSTFAYRLYAKMFVPVRNIFRK